MEVLQFPLLHSDVCIPARDAHGSNGSTLLAYRSRNTHKLCRSTYFFSSFFISIIICRTLSSSSSVVNSSGKMFSSPMKNTLAANSSLASRTDSPCLAALGRNRQTDGDCLGSWDAVRPHCEPGSQHNNKSGATLLVWVHPVYAGVIGMITQTKTNYQKP